MKRSKIYGVMACILTLLGYWVLSRKDRKIDKNIENPILQENQKEKIIVNQKKHQAIIITSGKPEEKVYLNPRDKVSIIENKDGAIVIQQRTWGTEHAPIIGISYSNSARLDAGVALFYIHSFDCGVGLSSRLNPMGINSMAFLSWNFRESLLFYGKYGTDKKFGLGIGYRF